MDLLAYFRVLRRRWLLILAFVVAGGTIGAASTLLSQASGNTGKHFKATHTLAFQEAGDGGNSDNQTARPAIANLDQAAILVTTGDVPTQVAKQLGMTPFQVTERITTKTNSDSGTLAITGIGTDAKDAERLTDTVAQQTIDTLNAKEQSRFDKVSRDTITRLDKLRNDIADLDRQLAVPGASDLARAERDGLVDQYRLAFERFQQLASQGAPTGELSTLETAAAVPISEGAYDTLRDQGQLGENHSRAEDQQQNQNGSSSGSSTPSFDSPVSRGVLGAFIGLLLGVGLALVAERFDRRLRTRDDVAAAFELPVLAEVPRLPAKDVREKEIVVHAAPISRGAEAYRAVRSSLMFQRAQLDGSGADGSGGGNGAGSGTSASAKPNGLVVMVASAVPGDGKTTTSVNLAAAFAEMGSSVLVVNCDFRRPMAHVYLRAADKPRQTLRTAIPGVWFVSSAVSEPDANPAQVIAAQQHVIATARDHFDVIVLDTAPLLTANDAVEVVGSADLVVLAARFQATTSDNAQRAMELLHRVDAPVTGVVVIGTPEDAGAYYYYEYRTRGRRAARAAAVEQEVAHRDDLPYDADTDAMDDGLFAGSSGESESSG
jgi:Mrp family chromosome partitioning ATPase/capsular polysaccharide biosynthesis protein